MNFNEKIIYLRKKNGMSQEDMAEKLGVSRWEQGSAMPDATNILRISRIAGVTADWLLDSESAPGENMASEADKAENDTNRIMIYLLTLEAMTLLIQFMCVFILQNIFFSFLSFVPFIAVIGGFEYAYIKNGRNSARAKFRRRFYKISAWLGLYFPVRFTISVAISLYPRPYTVLLKECITLVIYIAVCTLANLHTDRQYTKK